MIMEVNMAGYIELGKKIYDMNNPREVRRMAVFVARSILHNSGMQTIINYFDSNAELKSQCIPQKKQTNQRKKVCIKEKRTKNIKGKKEK